MNWAYQLGAKVKALHQGVVVEGTIGVRDQVQHSKGVASPRYFVVNKSLPLHEFGFDVLEKDVTAI